MEMKVETEKKGAKRTVMTPGNDRPAGSGDLVSVDTAADEEVQWIWCHHGERGSSVIGYVIVPRERMDVPEARPIGFFPLEEKR